VDLKLEISLAELIQIAVLILTLMVFYFKMVKAFTRISSLVDSHEKIIHAPNGEVDVVTYRALDIIRARCPNNNKIDRLEHDVELLQQVGG
jgi:uncharacterized protein YoxC